MKSLTEDDHPFAHAKIKNWIFDFQFPGNSFEFTIVLDDFGGSEIWASWIQISFAEFKNLQNSGIQPTYNQFESYTTDVNLEISIESYFLVWMGLINQTNSVVVSDQIHCITKLSIHQRSKSRISKCRQYVGDRGRYSVTDTPVMSPI